MNAYYKSTKESKMSLEAEHGSALENFCESIWEVLEVDNELENAIGEKVLDGLELYTFQKGGRDCLAERYSDVEGPMIEKWYDCECTCSDIRALAICAFDLDLEE